jgi:hypothetical protein
MITDVYKGSYTACHIPICRGKENVGAGKSPLLSPIATTYAKLPWQTRVYFLPDSTL